MGSRFFKSLFGGSSNSNSNSLKTGSGSYESTIALEPPVKGYYPVAGNGPNVEEVLQRARIKREAKQNEGRTDRIVSNIASRPPNIPRTRSDNSQIPVQRPRTAPHTGEAVGYGATRLGDGRTSSGFSMKAPPSFFPSKRRSSLRSIKSPLVVDSLPPVPPKPVVRDIQTYIPKGGPTPVPTPPNDLPEVVGFTPPFAQKQHQRNFSRNSQSSHVDILDAYSNMKGNEVASIREKASGVKGYGEDVADRNIAVFGDQKLDMSSSDFGYLKSVYSGQKRQAGDEVAHQTSPVAKTDGDDTVGPKTKFRVRSSTPLSSTGINPDYVSTNNRPHIGSYALDPDPRDQALLPYSSTPSKPETPPPKNPRRQNSDPIDFNSLPRGRQVRDSSAPFILPQRLSSLGNIHPRVVSPVEESPRSPLFQTSPSEVTHPHSRSPSKPSNQKTMGHSSSKPVSRNNSVTYSAFPNTTPSPDLTSSFSSQPRPIGNRQTHTMDRSNEGRQPSSMAYSPAFTIKPIPSDYVQPSSSTPRSINNGLSNGNSRGNRHYVVEGAKDAPNLDGIVDLTDTVDTKVVTNTLPAIIHEQVIPTRHEIREEKITREIHTHDVFHRVLPIIETEILPTKHYIHAPDGKSLIEIPESQIPGRTKGGSGYWQFVPTPPVQQPEPRPQSQYRRSSNNHITRKPLPTESDDIDEAAEPPVVALARGELPPHTKSPSRGNSRASIKNFFEPILASKRESVSADGSFKIEYLWRHPPQFENFSRPGSIRSLSLSQNPTYIGAGIGDISPESVVAGNTSSYNNHNGSGIGRDYYLSDEETSSSLSPREGQEMLFRDSGYGNTGGLPGIQTGASAMNAAFDRMKLDHSHKRSKGSLQDGHVLVEREDESDEEEMVEERFRIANRKMREVRARRSRGEIRSASASHPGPRSAIVVD